MFTTFSLSLKALLNDVQSGKIQLPDFQRGWVWDDDRIRGLLASISRGFPVGAVMTLSSGGDIRFRTRLVDELAPFSVPGGMLEVPAPEMILWAGWFPVLVADSRGSCAALATQPLAPVKLGDKGSFGRTLDHPKLRSGMRLGI